jgi:hypothetical protein
MRGWLPFAFRYIAVTEINHSTPKTNILNWLQNCLNFNQMSSVSSTATMRVFWRQVFNQLIHRIGGYIESVCGLNQLTRL